MNLAIAIMAAGQSQRFNGCKLLAEVNGVPLLEHAIRKAKQLQPESMQVITGAWHSQLMEALQTGKLSPVELSECQNWSEGLGASIAHAISQLPESTDHLLIMLADQIAITPADLNKLVERADEAEIICAGYSNRRGVPALFRSNLFPALSILPGDKGAREILRSNHYSTLQIDLPRGATDIDTLESLNRYVNSKSLRIVAEP